MKFIDTHAHAYRRPVAFDPIPKFCTAAELREKYRAEGVQTGAILPIVSPEIYFPQTNEDVLDMVAESPDTFFAFCNLDPRLLTNSADARLDRVLGYYRDLGCRGVGEIMPNLPMNHPMVQNLFRCAETAGLPVTFDGSDQLTGDFGLYDDPGMPMLEHTLQRFPNLRMIGHGMTFWTEYTPLLRPALRKTCFTPEGIQVGWNPPEGKVEAEGAVQTLLRRYDNLSAELSDACCQLMRDPDYAASFLTEFQDRLFFGSDTCSFQHPMTLKHFLDDLHSSGKITDAVFRKVCRNNAIDFFRLDLKKED